VINPYTNERTPFTLRPNPIHGRNLATKWWRRVADDGVPFEKHA